MPSWPPRYLRADRRTPTHGWRSAISWSLSSPPACFEYALAASATAIGWSGYLNNFLDNAFGWSIPGHCTQSMLVAGKAGLEVHFDHFNLPPVILVVLCAILLLRGTRESALVNAGMVLLKLLVLVFFAVIAWADSAARTSRRFFNSSGHDRCDHRLPAPCSSRLSG